MATLAAIRSHTNPDVSLSGGSRRRPPIHRAASGFSGRRFCRIFPNDSRWILQIEHGGWSREGSRKTFATLTAAIVYAVAHGLSYRVVHAAPDEAGIDARWTAVKKSPGEVLTAKARFLTRKAGSPLCARTL
jgi:hypothetical protein